MPSRARLARGQARRRARAHGAYLALVLQRGAPGQQARGRLRRGIQPARRPRGIRRKVRAAPHLHTPPHTHVRPRTPPYTSVHQLLTPPHAASRRLTPPPPTLTGGGLGPQSGATAHATTSAIARSATGTAVCGHTRPARQAPRSSTYCISTPRRRVHAYIHVHMHMHIPRARECKVCTCARARARALQCMLQCMLQCTCMRMCSTLAQRTATRATFQRLLVTYARAHTRSHAEGLSPPHVDEDLHPGAYTPPLPCAQVQLRYS